MADRRGKGSYAKRSYKGGKFYRPTDRIGSYIAGIGVIYHLTVNQRDVL